MNYLNSAQRISKETVELTYILIDISSSMDAVDYKPTRKDGAIQANMKLVQTKSKIHPQDYLGIIAFNRSAHLLHGHEPVGKGSQSLCQTLRRNTIGGGSTDFTKALKLAKQCLFQTMVQKKNPTSIFSRFFGDLFLEQEASIEYLREIPVNEKVTRRIIMLTDGDHNGDGSPVDIATQLKSLGVIIECIGIAGNRNDVNEDLLKQIASIDECGIPRYTFINDTYGLLRKYQSMATHLRVPVRNER